MEINYKIIIIGFASLLVFLVIYFLLYRKQKKNIKALGLYTDRFLGEINIITTTIKWISFIIFALFLIIAYARPKFGEKDVNIKRKGIDVILAIDVSRSMQAEDVSPNRLLYAKTVAKEIVKRFGDGRIGLIVFAGDGYVLAPLTDDIDVVKEFLDDIDEDILTDGGTNFYNMVIKAKELFYSNITSKLLVIFSDGEDHSNLISEAIDTLKKANIKVVSIGVGTKQGAPIFIKDKYGNKQYYRDNKGNIIYTKLIEDNLIKLAVATKGQYFNLNGNFLNLKAIINYLQKYKKDELSVKKVVKKEEQYQMFLLIAIICFIIFLFLYNWPRSKKNI